MSTRGHNRSKFQLETLESRTLLAGDPTAITSSSAFVSTFDPASPNSLIVVAGLAGGELNIDATLLPSTLKELNISGFDKVTISGTDQIATLDLARIGTFSAPGIDVLSSLNVDQVSSLTLHSISGGGSLAGHETRLDVFDSRSATLYSTLDHLTVSSSLEVVNLISGNPNQDITLEFPTGNSEILGPSKQMLHASELTSDSVHTFTGAQTTYNVVVLSLSATNPNDDVFVLRLQDALKKGDSDGVKNAFSDYLKGLGVSGGSAPVVIPATAPSEITLAEAARLKNASSFLELSLGHPVLHVATQAPDHDLLVFGAALTTSKESPLASKNLGDSTGAGGSAPADLFGPLVAAVSVKTGVSDQVAQNAGQAAAPGEAHPMVDLVRSSLSTLVTEVSTDVKTVSAYIMNRVGNELDPAVQPGLLVDAKSPRSAREADWFQV